MRYRNSQNLSHNLWMRELNLNHGLRHPVPQQFLFHRRNFYKSITPRMTVQNIDKPLGFLRKFTPDGQMLLVFTPDQKSLDVYQYLGVGNAANLLSQQQGECITAADHSLLSLHIRQNIFSSLFKKKFNIPMVTSPAETNFLNRDFSLFIEGGNFVLLASMIGGSIFPNYLSFQYVDLFDDTELYDYTFHLVDLRKGRIVDNLRLEQDFIVLSHNHSVSVYERTVAILSTYRQCIELIEVNPTTGKFKRLFTIGPYGNNLDRDRILSHQRNENFAIDPTHNLPLSHLKQKILAFLYRDIMEIESLNDKRKHLGHFYKLFSQLERMVILKMQLIDNDNLLLRYEERQTRMPREMVVGCNVDAANRNFKIYVFYNITEQKVLKIYTKDSRELLIMLRNFCNEFRNVYSLQVPWHVSSPSNNNHFRAAFDKAIRSYAGGIPEAATRFNPTLPISSESFSTCPYLNYTLFDYDDNFISPIERPRPGTSEPIRFRDRHTRQLQFRLFLERPSETHQGNLEATRNPRDLVTFIFHPYEPIFISIQKFISRYVINLHLYNSSTRTQSVVRN